MHTRNVNVKTAAQESSRKMGEEQNPVSVAREWVAQATALKAGVTVTLSDVSRYGDVQVEIRTNGTLNWRAWSFEPDFLFELKRNLAIRADVTGGRTSGLNPEKEEPCRTLTPARRPERSDRPQKS